MGKVFSLIRAKNPLRNFNVEERAHKVISQSKPVVAPRHPREQVDFERLMKDYPDVYQESLKKNEKLDLRLKEIYVTSRDPHIDIKQTQNPDRPLPADRRQPEDFLFGIKEPEKVPLGKVTLSKALAFISKHQADPRNYTIKMIVDEHMLPEDKVRNIIKYFRVFEVYLPPQPEKGKNKPKFASPSLPRIEIITRKRKELPPGDLPKDKT